MLLVKNYSRTLLGDDKRLFPHFVVLSNHRIDLVCSAPKRQGRGNENRGGRRPTCSRLASGNVAIKGLSTAPWGLLQVDGNPLLSGFPPKALSASSFSSLKLSLLVTNHDEMRRQRQWTSGDGDRLTEKGKRFASNPLEEESKHSSLRPLSSVSSETLLVSLLFQNTPPK